MKHVRRSVLLWYSPREMYSLVTGVEQYPQFLPWCERAELLATDAEGVTARLSLAYMGVRHAFTTRNQHLPDRAVNVSLVDGPFSLLEGSWIFHPIGRGGRGGPAGGAGGEEPACKIEFDLRYAFTSGALEAVVSPVFDRVANTLVDAFVRRAEDVYGAR
jgi:ribosome-associated toxin RatA of RatAB toxin-antitoxin module